MANKVKIKILSVPSYMTINRDIKQGDIYKVNKVGINKHKEVVYLFESKNKKPSLVYEHEVELIK